MASCLTLKKSNCKNCYKCIRHCPVKSIRFSGNQAHIIENECILCGHCFVVCPQNAKEITSEREKVKVMIQGEGPVYVSLAPSFVANYDGIGIKAMRTALKKLGFADVEETALGANMVKNEYDRMLREDKRDVIISSCCHSVNLLIQNYFPKELPYLADVLSPMQAHCQDIKKRHPDAKCVFIGPCVAKKDEAARDSVFTDAVLTFEELSDWLKEAGVELVPEEEADNFSKARLFPTTGGILKSMGVEVSGYTYIAIDGIENCIQVLKDIESGEIHNCFIEMSSCVGSCVGGPVMEKSGKSPIKGFQKVVNYAGSEDFQLEQPDSTSLKKRFYQIQRTSQMPSEEQIQDILKQMGKFNKTQELNCGSCGYDTCREKAVAIFQGKAEPSMCLPFLKDKAESFSDTIVKNTPNAIVVLNEKLEVQQINEVARRLMHIRVASDVLGGNVIRILEPEVFHEVLEKGHNVYNRRVYLAEYERYVEQTVVNDTSLHLLVCIMRDVTDEEKERAKKETISAQTVEVADKVVDKQMRIVQEIASLLGETAAETKIALTKLKESISNE